MVHEIHLAIHGASVRGPRHIPAGLLQAFDEPCAYGVGNRWYADDMPMVIFFPSVAHPAAAKPIKIPRHTLVLAALMTSSPSDWSLKNGPVSPLMCFSWTGLARARTPARGLPARITAGCRAQTISRPHINGRSISQ